MNLRLINSDKDELKGTSLGYEYIRVEAWDVDRDEIISFLKIATDKKMTPVFVHCRHGADRTGLMTAIYRVVVCRWSKDEAIAEMTQGGFGFHERWDNLVEYIRELDIEQIEREAGITQ